MKSHPVFTCIMSRISYRYHNAAAMVKIMLCWSLCNEDLHCISCPQRMVAQQGKMNLSVHCTVSGLCVHMLTSLPA